MVVESLALPLSEPPPVTIAELVTVVCGLETVTVRVIGG